MEREVADHSQRGSQKGSQRRSLKRSLPVLILLAGAICVILVLALADPNSARWLPKCAFKAMTGWDCPGCGAQRMVHALCHGRIAEAWTLNPFLMLMLPLLGLYLWIDTQRLRRPRLYAATHKPWIILLFGLAVLGWTLGRNLL